MNIYTHLFPAIAFLLGAWYVIDYLHSNYTDITAVDSLMLVFFFPLTATTCLGLSTTYHTLINTRLGLRASGYVWTLLALCFSQWVASCPGYMWHFGVSRYNEEPTGRW